MEFKTSKESAVPSRKPLGLEIGPVEVIVDSSKDLEKLVVVCNVSLAWHLHVVLGEMPLDEVKPFLPGDGAGVVSVETLPHFVESCRNFSAFGRLLTASSLGLNGGHDAKSSEEKGVKFHLLF